MSLLKPLVFGTPRLEYLKCVLKDPEFKLRASQIHEKLSLKQGEKLALKEVGDIYLPYIEMTKPRNIDKKIISLIGSIETDFELGPDETIGLLNGELPKPQENEGNVFIVTEEKPGNPPERTFSIQIYEGATKREIIESLSGIEEKMEEFFKTKSKKRVKGPQNYQLIYAIHRARRRGKKFSEIFTQYCLGTLENYSGSRGMNSVNKFREYYRTYEPKEPNKTVSYYELKNGEPLVVKEIYAGIDQSK